MSTPIFINNNYGFSCGKCNFFTRNNSIICVDNLVVTSILLELDAREI